MTKMAAWEFFLQDGGVSESYPQDGGVGELPTRWRQCNKEKQRRICITFTV